LIPLNSLLRLGIHIPYAATIALSLGADAQVDRLKRLMIQAIERRERSHWLCRIGMHSMVWKVELHIGRRPWSRYQLCHFQLGFCRSCGLGTQRWVGEAAYGSLDLTGNERLALAVELRCTTDDGHSPGSFRTRTLKGILDKLALPPPRPPLPPLKTYEPPRFARGRRRR